MTSVSRHRAQAIRYHQFILVAQMQLSLGPLEHRARNQRGMCRSCVPAFFRGVQLRSGTIRYDSLPSPYVMFTAKIYRESKPVVIVSRGAMVRVVCRRRLWRDYRSHDISRSNTYWRNWSSLLSFPVSSLFVIERPRKRPSAYLFYNRLSQKRYKSKFKCKVEYGHKLLQRIYLKNFNNLLPIKLWAQSV